ncbi:MAG: hypothetical protein ETSY1_41875 [Candidatus Entotheonella factor]|uniref:Uncharacterized protein n=1 Tax=Entotheonella factor TaxID=1429438 RepID=W4L480_ENTF1|nr:MAG: hypothetical protein ETSY1_41875 [Candidatus Entotheonella factor]
MVCRILSPKVSFSEESIRFPEALIGEKKIERFLKALRDEKQDYVDVLVENGVAPNKFEECHLRVHWFPSNPHHPKAWWKNLQPIAPVARESMILAFDIAQKRELPVDVLWLCPDGNNAFDATVSWNETQVTRILITPPIPKEFPEFRGPNPKGVSSKDIAGIYIVEQKDRKGNRIVPPEPELIETRVHPPAFSIAAVQRSVEDCDIKDHDHVTSGPTYDVDRKNWSDIEDEDGNA